MSNIARLFEYLSTYLTPSRLAKFESVLNNRTNHITLVAQDIYHEHNAGALVRTCDCFGIQKMAIIEQRHTYKLSRRMAKGAEKWVDISYYNEEESGINRCISNLKNQGYRIVATTPRQGSTTPELYDIKNKTALFFGLEKEGLSKEILESADEHLTIPMVGFTESFNVSVSAAILLYALAVKMVKDPQIDWQLTEEERLFKKIDWSLKTIRNGPQLLEHFIKSHPQEDFSWLEGITKYYNPSTK